MKRMAITLVIGAAMILGYTVANAAQVQMTGMEIIGTLRVGVSTLYKVTDHDNGATCYVIGSSVSCISATK